MKLRECEGKPAELIVYLRENTADPKPSDFAVFSVPDAQQGFKILSASHGVLGIVEKTRQLYFLGSTRIHLDSVKGLGDFMELEVLLECKGETIAHRSPQEIAANKDASAAVGAKTARDLMAKLGIKPQDLLSCAYIDMLMTTPNSCATAVCAQRKN